MPRRPYATAPLASTRMPPGVPYIVGNEAAERFSFYGMRAILMIFMTKLLRDSAGQLAPMTPAEASVWMHTFNSAVYFLPFFGAILADAFWGKYRTVLSLSMVYCLGHLALAVDDTRLGLALGLTLIALGAGGIKSCVSANVGDQFGSSNQHLMTKVFGWFYLSINVGSAASMLLIPTLLHYFGPHVAFAVPGVLMGVATLVFWMGRYRFVHIPPGGWGFVRETFSGEGLGAIARLAVIYVFVAPFWAIFDQQGSSWVEQATYMDLQWLGIVWLPSQVQAINPVLILVFIPFFSYVLYPAVSRVWELTPLRRIGLGLFLAAVGAAVPAVIQTWIDAGARPSIGWQALAYVLITAAEVMVSVTALEFSYTQAPKRMKSLVMGVYLLSISMGNLITAGVNRYLEGTASGGEYYEPSYYWGFSGLMLAAAVVFVGVAMVYRGRTYIQDEVAAQ